MPLKILAALLRILTGIVRNPNIPKESIGPVQVESGVQISLVQRDGDSGGNARAEPAVS